ncbi:GNAT family N-acetyltransferase [Alistipes montrealensis]|uniref:GNAT family N-acetyltransferase n=1 Tax=Alistipes montrealensis TaxID=2834113 RepID=UPI003743DAD9
MPLPGRTARGRFPDDRRNRLRTGPRLRTQRHMAEAVEALCTWTLQQEGVRHITAETDADGFASQRLLLKCGFREHSRAETCRWIR